MSLTNRSRRSGTSTLSFQRWHLTLVVVFFMLLAYRHTLDAMVHVWNTSETYAHGWLVPLISLYLIYQKKQELSAIHAPPAWWALGPLGVFGAIWTLALLADVHVVQELMLVAMILSAILFIMGWEWCETIAFPLGFLFLAVPMGDGLTPYMVDMTADFVVYALRVTGMPVYREGSLFIIPSGTWSVVSGCSGMRYLIATVTVGILFAYLNYRSIWRRVTFMGVAVLVAVFANWLRAYGIVMIAHLSGMKLALGIDHYIYGWVFFGIVIFLLMTVGMIWSEPVLAVLPADPAVKSRSAKEIPLVSSLGAVLVTLLAVNVWPLLGGYASAPVAHPALAFDAQLISPSSPWRAVSPPDYQWQPHFVGTPLYFSKAFVQDADMAGLLIAWYPEQSQTAEIVHAANELVWEKNEPWRSLSATTYPLTLKEIHAVSETILKRRSDGREMLVWQIYWVDGHFTSSKLLAKLYEAESRLLGHGSAGGIMLLYALVEQDGHEDDVRRRLQSLLEGSEPGVTRGFVQASRKNPVGDP